MTHLGDVWGTGAHGANDTGSVSRAYRDDAGVNLYRIHLQLTDFAAHDPTDPNPCAMDLSGVNYAAIADDRWLPDHACVEYSNARKLEDGLAEGRAVVVSITEDQYGSPGSADPLRSPQCASYTANWRAYSHAVASMIRDQFPAEVTSDRIWFECHNEPNSRWKYWPGDGHGPCNTSQLNDGLWADRASAATVECLKGIRDAFAADGYMPTTMIGSLIMYPGAPECQVQDYIQELRHELAGGSAPPISSFGIHYPGDEGQLGRLVNWMYHPSEGLHLPIYNTEMFLRHDDPDCDTPGSCPLDMNSVAGALYYAHKLINNARYGVRGVFVYEQFGFPGENGANNDHKYVFLTAQKEPGGYCYSNTITESRAYGMLRMAQDTLRDGELYAPPQWSPVLALANEKAEGGVLRTELLLLNRSHAAAPSSLLLAGCSGLSAQILDATRTGASWSEYDDTTGIIPARSLVRFRWNEGRGCAQPRPGPPNGACFYQEVLSMPGPFFTVADQDSRRVYPINTSGQGFRCAKVEFDMTAPDLQNILNNYGGCPILLHTGGLRILHNGQHRSIATGWFRFKAVGCHDRSGAALEVSVNAIETGIHAPGQIIPDSATYRLKFEVDRLSAASLRIFKGGQQVGSTLQLAIAGVDVSGTRNAEVAFGLNGIYDNAYFPYYGATYSNLRVEMDLEP